MTDPEYRLPDIFYSMPKMASAALTRRQLREILLTTNGKILACGYMWEIVQKHLGAGIYRVTLKRDSDD